MATVLAVGVVRLSRDSGSLDLVRRLNAPRLGRELMGCRGPNQASRLSSADVPTGYYAFSQVERPLRSKTVAQWLIATSAVWFFSLTISPSIA